MRVRPVAGLIALATVLMLPLCGAAQELAVGSAQGSQGAALSGRAASEGARRFDFLMIGVLVDGEVVTPTARLVSGINVGGGWQVGLGAQYVHLSDRWSVPLFLQMAVQQDPTGPPVTVSAEVGYSLQWIDGITATEGSGPFVGLGVRRRLESRLLSFSEVALGWMVQWSQESGGVIGDAYLPSHLVFLSLGWGW